MANGLIFKTSPDIHPHPMQERALYSIEIIFTIGTIKKDMEKITMSALQAHNSFSKQSLRKNYISRLRRNKRRKGNGKKRTTSIFLSIALFENFHVHSVLIGKYKNNFHLYFPKSFIIVIALAL